MALRGGLHKEENYFVTPLSKFRLVVLPDAGLTAGLGRGAQDLRQPAFDVGPEVAGAARDGDPRLGVLEELDEHFREEVAIADRRSHAIRGRAGHLDAECMAVRLRKAFEKESV